MSSKPKAGFGQKVRSKPLPAAGSLPLLSSRIGGVGNADSKPATKSGKVDSFNKGGIAGYNPGGFRNRAMEHKR